MRNMQSKIPGIQNGSPKIVKMVAQNCKNGCPKIVIFSQNESYIPGIKFIILNLS